jgi:hypothetical protein
MNQGTLGIVIPMGWAQVGGVVVWLCYCVEAERKAVYQGRKAGYGGRKVVCESRKAVYQGRVSRT